MKAGIKRVVITGVSPVVEAGRYHAKGIATKPLRVSASVFCDGHDEVRAALLFRKEGGVWHEYPMTFVNNDLYEHTVIMAQSGRYEFRISGWVDHFATWQKGLEKKLAAGQNVQVDLQIGAQLMLAAGILSKEEAAALKGTDLHRFLAENALRMTTYRDPNLVVQTQVYNLEAGPVRAGFSTWYELFPRSASPVAGRHGTFNDAEKLLPRIKAMGFDVLYLPPIHPIGEKNRKGKNNSLTATENDPGSPWAIGSRLGGHKAIHPELGTLAEFRQLLAAARDEGIELALDIAFQCAPDHPYVTEHPAWFQWRPDGTVQYAENPPKKYEDILPFNFESSDWEGLWQELKSVLAYWVSQGVEIFRIDNPHTKSFSFWEWAIAEIKSINANVIFLAEAFTRPRLMEQLAKGGFDQSYTYFTWRTGKKELEAYLTELTQGESKNYFRPNFWPNTPDILPPHLTQGGETAHLMRLILAATLSSNYGMYGPVYEFGLSTPMAGKEEYVDGEKYEIRNWNWHAYTRIREVITRVNHIRKENPALQQTENIVFLESTNENIICYLKSSEGSKILTAVNLNSYQPETSWVRYPGAADELHELLGGSVYNWQAEWNQLSIDPYQMPGHIYRVGSSASV